ncbi:hypothetical protein [Actinoplanes missouriensis]|uniref:hypothetical protein n=1 Tax=Actinoplanes missouriensis TaxID=1866 RepID=UPI00030950AB|nr:hypothetical protein [Actinoplanes missouriensis]
MSEADENLTVTEKSRLLELLLAIRTEPMKPLPQSALVEYVAVNVSAVGRGLAGGSAVVRSGVGLAGGRREGVDVTGAVEAAGDAEAGLETDGEAETEADGEAEADGDTDSDTDGDGETPAGTVAVASGWSSGMWFSTAWSSAADGWISCGSFPASVSEPPTRTTIQPTRATRTAAASPRMSRAGVN